MRIAFYAYYTEYTMMCMCMCVLTLCACVVLTPWKSKRTAAVCLRVNEAEERNPAHAAAAEWDCTRNKQI